MKILVIDDERSIRNSLKEILADEGYEVDVAEDGVQGYEMAEKEKYSVVFCDIKMPGMDGIEVLDKMVEAGIDSAVVMISGHGDISTAVECIKKGAFDYIPKPLDLNRILITIKNATEKVSLVKETRILKKKVYGQPMIGESPAILHIKEMIDKVAPTDARVLIIGSNGTGKELVARNLHQKSRRSSMPYVEVNCAAIPSELIESELFGHEKGAFTSAIKQHKGKFEQADGGTLFLDEIGNIPPHLQAKLLRAIQNKTITRVGDTKAIPVNIRLICATNKDMEKMVKEGKFREDLYYRINTMHLHLPALRERTDEILPLAEMFLCKYSEKYHRQLGGITPEAAELLKSHYWSGNIRELQNCIEKAVILAEGEMLTAADIELQHTKPQTVSGNDTLEEAEEKAIRAAMAKFGGNLSMVAKALEISRPTLYAKLKKYDI